VQREDGAARGEPPLEAAGRLTHDAKQCRQCDAGNDSAAEHDQFRRQREPFAEQPRETEQQHGGVQRNQCHCVAWA